MDLYIYIFVIDFSTRGLCLKKWNTWPGNFFWGGGVAWFVEKQLAFTFNFTPLNTFASSTCNVLLIHIYPHIYISHLLHTEFKFYLCMKSLPFYGMMYVHLTGKKLILLKLLLSTQEDLLEEISLRSTLTKTVTQLTGVVLGWQLIQASLCPTTHPQKSVFT